MADKIETRHENSIDPYTFFTQEIKNNNYVNMSICITYNKGENTLFI